MRNAILVLAVVWGAAGSALGVSQPPTWKGTMVGSGIADPGFQLGADRALAYDHHGNPGIAFCDATAGVLCYARWVPGIGWTWGDVDGGGDARTVVGWYPSLAYDRYERPAISYYNASQNELRYAHFDGKQWNISVLDGSTGYWLTGICSSLAFDIYGRPAIAYHDDNVGGLKFAYDDDGDGEFDVEIVSNEYDEGWYSSLAFDGLNRPMIAHEGYFGNNNLRFSVKEPGIGWVTTTIEGRASWLSCPSLAINPQTGYPGIAFLSDILPGPGDELAYVEWNGGGWPEEVVCSSSDYPHPSLAFDPADGNPGIAFYSTDPDGLGALYFAWRSGGVWHTQEAETDGIHDLGLTPSLAFNDYGTGYPAVAFLDDQGNLYFTEDPPVPEPGTLGLVVAGAWAIVRRRRLPQG